MKREPGKRSIQDTSGAAFIYVAFAMCAVIAVAGLAIDLGHWHAAQRTAQEAADSAAVAGAFEALWGGDAAAIENAATDQAALEGFAATAVTVNSPPRNRAVGAAPGAVEVIIEGPSVGFFGSLLVKNPVAVSTRSIAARRDGGELCFVVLAPGVEALEPETGSAGCGARAEIAGAQVIRIIGDGARRDQGAVFAAGSRFLSDDRWAGAGPGTRGARGDAAFE